MEYDITTSPLSFILSRHQWFSSSKSIVSKAAIWVVSIAVTIFIIRPFTQCISCGVGSNADAGTWAAKMTSSCLRWEVGTRFLTVNVPTIAAYRGPREWNRGCIAWALHGRCGGGAWAVRPTHLPTQLRPAHSVRPAQLNRGPRISRASAHLASRALIAQPAHFAWVCAARARGGHALISSSMQFSTHSICHPSKSRPMSSKANTIFLTQGQNRANHATNLSKQQPYRRVSNLVAFQNI